MRQILCAAALIALPAMASAQSQNSVIADTVETHILPRFETLTQTTAQLAATAQNDCSPTSPALRASYSNAFDAWISASHLRFGPTEVDDRAFALAFWPDSRGATPKTLQTIISDNDAVAYSPDDYAQVSIAARGFYALEFLLYDEALQSAGEPSYHCALVQTVTADIAANSAAIEQDWKTDYAARLLAPSENETYQSQEEVLQELFKALSTGLEFTSDTRLGRPLGTYDRPRPTRAESWRSGRSSRNAGLSLDALRDLTEHLASTSPDLAQRLDHAFERAQSQLIALDDPVFATVTDPQKRLKLEVVQQSIDSIRAIVRQDLGPTLGVVAGFNSLDGD